MAIFEEAEKRLYKNIYICKKCESKTRVPINKVLNGKAVCRSCSSKFLRPVRKRGKK